MNLYWVTTEDHADDWFIAANNAEEAISFHAAICWYDHDLVNAETVIGIPKKMDMHVGWPSMKELESLGANIIVNKFPRVVEFRGKRYFEQHRP